MSPTQPPRFRPTGTRTIQQRRQDYETRRKDDPAFRARKRIYDSAVWKQCRRTIITERLWCERCSLKGQRTPGTEVHHRIDLPQGDAFDPDNLELLCASCHSQHTATHHRGGHAG